MASVTGSTGASPWGHLRQRPPKCRRTSHLSLRLMSNSGKRGVFSSILPAWNRRFPDSPPSGRRWRNEAVSETETPDVPAITHSIDEVLTFVREALSLEDLPNGSLVKLTGSQELMEMNGIWEFIYSPEGKFVEVFVGSQYASIASYDGEHVWEGDVAGRVAVLDLDDYEVSLLAGWLKTGFWVESAAKKCLDIRELEEKDWEYLQRLEPPVSMDLDRSRHQFLAVSLNGKKTTMYVSVCSASWLPQSAILNAYGTSALAILDKWTTASAECPLRVAMVTSFLRDTGDLVRTEAAKVEILPGAEASREASGSALSSTEAALLAATIFPRSDLFRFPSTMSVPVPLDAFPVATFDPTAPPEVEAYLTPAGHVLVRPLIDGQDAGYFILDTGASTFTIEPAVADKLGMGKFGCVNTVTVNGPAKCSFRASRSFSLGPLNIVEPRYVDVSGAALAERSLPVAGICGFDIFRHCLVHLQRVKGKRAVTLRLLDPNTDIEERDILSPEQKITWIPIRMLSSTPHIPLEFQEASDSPRHQALFLLDTGAAGSDLIFNSASTQKYNLWPKGRGLAGGGIMRGMGGAGGGNNGGSSSTGMAVMQRVLNEVSIHPEINVKSVNAIVMAPQQSALQLSCYTAGLICQDLLKGFDVVFDYAKGRIGFVTLKDSSKDSGLKRLFSKAAGG